MKLLTKALFAGLALSLGIQFANASELAESLEKTKTVRVGTEGTYAPFTFHDEAGKLTGYDIDVTNEVAKRLGLTVVYQETLWDGIFAGLNAKRFDVIANQVSATPERAKKYAFSEPYNVSRAVIVTREDNDKIKSFADLKGVKSVQSATSNYTELAKKNGADLVIVDSLAQNLELVKQGRVAATVNEQIAVLDYFKKHPNVGLKIAVKNDETVGSVFTFLQGNEDVAAQFSKVLAEMRADGTLKALSIKWFGDDITQ
ncbi:cystine transport system substrate-binding protein [Cricetibacter osteomyelitidis]|uniref:Cystine transport system substrate-binding protein n=1 Tax=Cricetibacter osteomyelitidis TaxID=1521931 RepID=A0A4R2T0U9_9PAST|nr:amino acid ABC transporter substrate-binding protein [Cricetibacter osteomyelitidis]TCP96489.1 cystine transport system substrate-binding protein [Cricetibacter osteomyelitidis]